MRWLLLFVTIGANAELLTWNAVTQYEDGQPLVDPDYFVYCGREPGRYTYRSPPISEPTFMYLVNGSWYCAATASDGNMESDFSNEIAVKNTKPGKPTINGSN